MRIKQHASEKSTPIITHPSSHQSEDLLEGEEKKEKDLEREKEKEKEKEKNSESTLEQMAQVLVSQSPIASFALTQVNNRLGTTSMKGLLESISTTKEDKFWDGQEIDWTILCSISSIPSILFILLVAAAV